MALKRFRRAAIIMTLRHLKHEARIFESHIELQVRDDATHTPYRDVI